MPGQRNNLLPILDISDVEFLQDSYRRRVYGLPIDPEKEEERYELLAKISALTNVYYDEDMTVEAKKARLKELPKEIDKLFDALEA